MDLVQQLAQQVAHLTVVYVLNIIKNMKEKILNFIKKKESTEIARYLPLEGESWFNTYFVEVKNAFQRAWNWKFMWFWALFLAGGSSNVIGKLANVVSRNNNDAQAVFSDSTGGVFNEYNYILVAIVVIFILFMLILTVISYVATWGITRSISEIQDNGKPENDSFKEIWKKGKDGVIKLFIFGVIVFLIYISFFGGIIAIPFILNIVESKLVIAYVLFIIPVFLLFLFIGFYTVYIAITILILENSTPIKSIKKALHLIRHSYKEVGKLIIVRILLNMFIGIISLLYILMYVVIIGIAVFVSSFLIGTEASYLGVIIKIIIVLFDVVLVIGALIPIIIFGLISRLVFLDLWIWWVKRNIPSLREKSLK